METKSGTTWIEPSVCARHYPYVILLGIICPSKMRTLVSRELLRPAQGHI